MTAPTYVELGALLGKAVSSEQGQAVLTVITAMASSYTRGQGFTAGVPNNDIRAVILTASARLLSNATGLLYDETVGPESVSYRSAFQGFTHGELITLNRYRKQAM